MDEKGFFIRLIQCSLLVIMKSNEKVTFLVRQPSSQEKVTVIEAVGIFTQDISPRMIMKSEKYLYGWYHREMPRHWTTVVFFHNGWTDTSSGKDFLMDQGDHGDHGAGCWTRSTVVPLLHFADIILDCSI